MRDRDAEPHLRTGPINVRLFRVEGTDGMVMDTMGLSAFGLFDLQCHYRQIDQNVVARHLYDYAAYLFVQGNVIQDGETVDGLDGSGEWWECHHTVSLMPPDRAVIDVLPPLPYRGKRDG